jgi:hypothetical protein
MLPRRLFPGQLLVRRTVVRRLRDARGASAAAAPNSVGTTADAVVDAVAQPAAHADAGAARLGFRPRLGRHVVHAVITVERDGKLATFQVDRGTIGSIGDGKLTVSEAGGTSVTVATNDQTRVRRDGKKITLSDLKSGDDVYVISQASSGGADPVALRIAAPTKEPRGT